MKHTWEPNDILPGQRVGRPGRTEMWIIGYFAPDGNKIALTSLEDGMVQGPFTREELAAQLTQANEMPSEYLHRAEQALARKG